MKQPQIVRYGELKPCRTAFIDAYTPGSDKKENFTIIGAGVSESSDQHVHINATPGFNIGAAGQPPRCVNSLHYHHTAEVFFVLSGRWRFFWGRFGEDGEVILEAGDLIDIPTHIFRGFENIGTDYGMIMSILGGDDAGGGVVWSPEVLNEAQAHGLILGESGCLYDTTCGQQLPSYEQPMQPASDDFLASMPRYDVSDFVPYYLARYLDMVALAQKGPCDALSENGLIKDKTGFQIELLTQQSLTQGDYFSHQEQALMVMYGHWQIQCIDGNNKSSTELLNPGDTCFLCANIQYKLSVAASGNSSLFRVTPTQDPAGPTWQHNLNNSTDNK